MKVHLVWRLDYEDQDVLRVFSTHVAAYAYYQEMVRRWIYDNNVSKESAEREYGITEEEVYE
jgi:hypothetical protein